MDGSTFETFGIIIADFEIEDKGGKPKFFQKTFLVVDTKFEVILEMLFLKISNADMAFCKKTLTKKFYITNTTLLTTEQIQLINPKKFVIAALDTNSEIFVMHVGIWERKEMVIDPGKKAQIEAQNRA